MLLLDKCFPDCFLFHKSKKKRRKTNPNACHQRLLKINAESIVNLNVEQKTHLSVVVTGLGFTHGLLNTDNMSLLGLTVDYGPFGFVDSYDGGFVANCSDGEGRYALAKQPDV